VAQLVQYVNKRIVLSFFLLCMAGCDPKAAENNTANPHFTMKLEEIFDSECARRIARDSLSSELSKKKDHHPCFSSINEKGRDGLTPVFWAIRNRDAAAVSLMLGLGARPDVQLAGDFKHSSYISYASFSHSNEILRQLLEAGADPASYGDRGYHSLDAAISVDNIEGLLLLLEAGVDPGVTNSQGSPIIVRAVAAGKFQAAWLLLENGADPHQSAPNGLGVRRLIDAYGCDVPLSEKLWCHRFVEQVYEK